MSTISATAAGDSTFSTLGLERQPATRNSSLGQTDFLRLMTEQLKNQDPLKPLDNAQFLGQLAQFSTVQGIDKMQSAMEAVANVMESDQTLRAAALVGHDALVEASTLDLAAGAGVSGLVSAPWAGPITFEVVDASGTRVRQMTVDAPGAGDTAFAWDGRDDAGQPAAGGRYTIRAVSGSGDNVEALAVQVSARVDSVSIEPNGLVLNLAGLGSHPLSAIRRIG
ncbi:flagellar hook assembly protein FlgD [Lysobacter koreensis]|uniref:Basal-body rod modification protein FlgD n=1 Tax=Lysobacter koreensis TaxID=266122 RepID=A0ABW2YL56_9GAMM